MIRNFSDHAANERTFLAWVRTAIAVIAFGFVVEKFDLFVRLASASANRPVPAIHSRHLGEAAGLALIVAGLVIVLIATVRFLRTAKQIDAVEMTPGPGTRLDVALAALLVLLGLALFTYLVQSLLTPA